MANALDENWELLLTLFPLGWEQQAILSGALERLRGFDSAADLLRVLLLHVGKGYSLRETVVRARVTEPWRSLARRRLGSSGRLFESFM